MKLFQAILCFTLSIASCFAAATQQNPSNITARGDGGEGGESGLDRREDRSGQDDDLNR